MAIPLYEFLVGDEGLGMTAISLVEKPAIESQFIAFDETKPKQKYVKLSGEYKNMIAGLALIPDKLIYRIDSESKEEYYGYFSSETIEKIRNKFHKAKNTSEVNLGHDDDNFIDAYLVESYILDTQARVDEVLARGIEEACLGAWFVTYKIEDDQAFEKAVEGELTGFSVEVMLNRELKLNKNNKTNKFMNKFEGFLNRFKALLSELETEQVLDEVKLSDAVLADGSKTVRYGAIGEPVNYVLTDEAGVETLELVAEGEYILEDGQKLEVDANGNLTEIKAAEDVIAPVEAETEVALAEVSGDTQTSDMDKKLSELIPLDKDGDYYISVSVWDGKASYGSMSTWTNLKLKAEAESDEVKALKLQVEELQAKVVAPITTPVEVKAEITPKKVVSKQDLAKMTPLQKELYKLGLEDFRTK